ncbi:MAG: ATP-binding protein [Planctomycetota bacterium]
MKSLSLGLRFKLVFANALVVLVCLFAPMRAFRDTAEDLITVGFDIRCRLVAKMLVKMAEERLQKDGLTSVRDLKPRSDLLQYFRVANDEMRYVALLDARGAVVEDESAPGFQPQPSPPYPDNPQTSELSGEHIKQFDWEIIVRRPAGAADDARSGQSSKDPTLYQRAGFARVGVSMAGVDERIGILHARFWLVLWLALLAETVVIFFLIWPFVRRIKDLIRGTQSVAHGDFSVQLTDDKEDELSQLADAFNGMTTDLRSLRDELEQHNHTLEQRVKERTAALNEALEKLKILDKMKDDFLSSISHEFRTPLTSIRSFSEILLEVPEENEQTKREFLHIIKTESDRLTRLVNDVLDLVKMEAGEMRFDLKPVSMVELVERTVDSLYPIAQARSVMVHIEAAPQLPLVRADPDRITQVIHNLLGNALKFSPDGRRIEIRVEQKEQAVRVSVRDQGIGVSPADLTRIFEKFNQVGDTLKNKPPGTGLGLSICRSLVQRHGGRIWAEIPDDGPGLRVAFEVPLPAPEPVAPAIASEVSGGAAVPV